MPPAPITLRVSVYLMSGDTNRMIDVFLRDQGAGFGGYVVFFPFIHHEGECGPGW